jgi:cytochrome c553
MKKFVLLYWFVVALAFATAVQNLPEWAYVTRRPDLKDPVDDGSLRHVPDSSRAWTLTQLQDFFFAPDWHPEDHPPLPEIVAHGSKPEVFACGFCHRADGPGGPENAALAGLSQAYIVQQMADFKSGARRSALPERKPAASMVAVAQAATDAEVASAAAYFSSLKPRKTITVIETDLVPKTHVVGWILAPVADQTKEPIGRRIIETPKDVEQFESRDARSEFIAYVPTGSVGRGAALVKTGGDGTTVQCNLCHGPDLKGLGAVPGIAGRSPSYIVRQLIDFQRGKRTSAAGLPMKGVVANLNQDDFVSIAAYTASLAP